MGIDDRQYMHRWGCDCILCKEAFEREQSRKIAKERKDKEFADNLNRMLNINEKKDDNIFLQLDLKCQICGKETIIRRCLDGQNKDKRFYLCIDYLDDGTGCQWKKQIDD